MKIVAVSSLRHEEGEIFVVATRDREVLFGEEQIVREKDVNVISVTCKENGEPKELAFVEDESVRENNSI